MYPGLFSSSSFVIYVLSVCITTLELHFPKKTMRGPGTTLGTLQLFAARHDGSNCNKLPAPLLLRVLPLAMRVIDDLNNRVLKADYPPSARSAPTRSLLRSSHAVSRGSSQRLVTLWRIRKVNYANYLWYLARLGCPSHQAEDKVVQPYCFSASVLR